jgi:undecaprenyl diphosphate synthase
MALPQHLAIIMDGNGRWAAKQGQPRTMGHKAGIEPVRMSIRESARTGIEALTLFAFSSENWQRPTAEVSSLMSLFIEALDREVAELHSNRVRMRFIGARDNLSVRLQSRMAAAEQHTAANEGLQLQIAVSYGGRWDIVQACRELAGECARGALAVKDITEQRFSAALALAALPAPDLFIRTGGEQRISNFLLWDLAYTELYFTDCLWPDFNTQEFARALAFFENRERRFGLVAGKSGAA